MLHEAGRRTADGTPVTAWEARRGAEETYIALRRLGRLVKDSHKPSDSEHPTREGATFARAALLTWPK